MGRGPYRAWVVGSQHPYAASPASRIVARTSASSPGRWPVSPTDTARPTCRRPTSCRRTEPGTPSGSTSSTRSTARPRSPTSPSTDSSTTCRRARRRTAASGKLDQDGRSGPLPAPSQGWAGEISLDLDMVSAVCPQCGITLIEADSPTDDMLEAVRTASRLGAEYVSLSSGWPGRPATSPTSTTPTSAPAESSTQPPPATTTTAPVRHTPASSAATTAIGGTSLVNDRLGPRLVRDGVRQLPGFGPVRAARP